MGANQGLWPRGPQACAPPQAEAPTLGPLAAQERQQPHRQLPPSDPCQRKRQQQPQLPRPRRLHCQHFAIMAVQAYLALCPAPCPAARLAGAPCSLPCAPVGLVAAGGRVNHGQGAVGASHAAHGCQDHNRRAVGGGVAGVLQERVARGGVGRCSAVALQCSAMQLTLLRPACSSK